jgi:hypothetical protein
MTGMTLGNPLFGSYALGALESPSGPAVDAPAAPDRNPFLGIGAVSAVAGAAMGTVGAYYGAKSSKMQARSAAMAADFEASMAARNARLAEMDAQTERDAGRLQLRSLGLQYGQLAGRQVAQQAAAGVDLGSGNALEQRVSLRLAQRMDALTINQNTARGVSARMAQATNFRNQAAMGRVTAGNLRATAGSISPGLSTFSGLLDGASRAAFPLYAYSRS